MPRLWPERRLVSLESRLPPIVDLTTAQHAEGLAIVAPTNRHQLEGMPTHRRGEKSSFRSLTNGFRDRSRAKKRLASYRVAGENHPSGPEHHVANSNSLGCSQNLSFSANGKIGIATTELCDNNKAAWHASWAAPIRQSAPPGELLGNWVFTTQRRLRPSVGDVLTEFARSEKSCYKLRGRNSRKVDSVS